MCGLGKKKDKIMSAISYMLTKGIQVDIITAPFLTTLTSNKEKLKYRFSLS